MLSFSQFTRESKMRQGLPHFKDLKPLELQSLISSGNLSGHITEKTDGLAFGIGYDKDGFYTRSARSDKVRIPGEYTAWGKRTHGEDYVSPYSSHYDEIHNRLQDNQKLIRYLKDLHEESNGNDISIQGEMFWKPLGELSEKGIKFVGTHYDPKKMGTQGKFVMHSNLPANVYHDFHKVSELSDDAIHFDHDKVPNGGVHIDVSDERDQFDSLDHEKMNSRKKVDAEEKEIQKKKFQAIKDSIENKLREHINSKITPKFGDETEGHVFHPSNPNSSRFKLTSESFVKFKEIQKKEKK